MKHKKFYAAALVISMLFTLFMSGCGASDPGSSDKTAAEYEAQIQELQEEIRVLEEQLAQYVPSTEESSISEEPSPVETSESAETVSPEEQVEAPAESEAAPEQTDEKKQVVVFGDSIWDSTRDETGISYLLSQYTGMEVYNCAIGGTRASMKPGESPDNFEEWDSTSLAGMINVAIGNVDPEQFLEGYVAGGVIRNIDFSKTDYFIIAYGLNDYFSAAPLNVEGGSSWDPHGYGGALRFAINRLNTNFPDAQILLISPTYCQFYKDGYMYTDSNMKDFGAGTLTDYANACRNVAEMNNTLFIDGYSTLGINGYTAEEYLEDGIHLTAKGRELYAKAVSSCLKYGKPGEVSGNSIYY